MIMCASEFCLFYGLCAQPRTIMYSNTTQDGFVRNVLISELVKLNSNVVGVTNT